MYRFNIPVPPDDDFPEVVIAQRMGEGFEKEYVEYEPRWRFDKRRRAVVVDEKFFYAMAGTADRLKAENDELRKRAVAMLSELRGVVSEGDYDSPSGRYFLLRRDVAAYEDALRELGIEVD